MNILALCGSLRAQSRSLALLEATRLLAQGQAEVHVFKGLGGLPLFNPDLEACAPCDVHALWGAVSKADVVLIASPEYAHGVTGTIKNALDWLVGHMPFVHKPVAVFNPSHRAHHADEALRETLRTMNAQLIEGACLRIPATACELDAQSMAINEPYSGLIQRALSAMTAHHLAR